MFFLICERNSENVFFNLLFINVELHYHTWFTKDEGFSVRKMNTRNRK